jgi:hypothetical protein
VRKKSCFQKRPQPLQTEGFGTEAVSAKSRGLIATSGATIVREVDAVEEVAVIEFDAAVCTAISDNRAPSDIMNVTHFDLFVVLRPGFDGRHERHLARHFSNIRVTLVVVAFILDEAVFTLQLCRMF